MNRKAELNDSLRAIVSGKYTDVSCGLLLLLNCRKKWKEKETGIEILTGSSGKVLVPVKDKKKKEYLVNNVLKKFSAFEEEFIRKFLVHNLTHTIEDTKKSNLGKYYTPVHLVNLICELCEPHINKKSIIMDIAAGCGAFLEHFKMNKIIGRDIDPVAVNVMKELGFENIECDNSLQNVRRSKYNLKDSDHLVIIGNPPYNDTTSKNKKRGRNAKEGINMSTDKDILTNDLGISFLRAFNKLSADVVCVLHPLSYLIKESNFNRKLKPFIKNYVLKKAVIFSSSEFADTQKTPFPVAAALYVRSEGGMSYQFIKNFRFNTLGSNDYYSIRNVETIDGYIRKYPPAKNDPAALSDIGLYMYNFRDLNSLISGSNFTTKINLDYHITVNYKELYKYCYLNCLKRYFGKDFRFGNLSPIVRKNDLESNEYRRNMFIIDTIINNQSVSVFDINDKNSIIYKKSLFSEFRQKSQQHKSRKLNIYEMFCRMVEGKTKDRELITDTVKKYFDRLKKHAVQQMNAAPDKVKDNETTTQQSLF